MRGKRWPVRPYSQVCWLLPVPLEQKGNAGVLLDQVCLFVLEEKGGGWVGGSDIRGWGS